MTRAPRQRTTAWAIALVVTVTALAVQVTAQVGRNGCLRHGADSAAAIELAGNATHDAQLGSAHEGTAVHAACALCAAPAPNATTATTAAPTVLAIRIAAGSPPRLALPAPPADGPPLDYAPKTSPPLA